MTGGKETMTDLPTEILMQLVRARYTCLMQLATWDAAKGTY